MIRGICLSTVAFVMLAAATFAAENTCALPMVPAMPDGATASRDQVIAAAASVKTYVTASDTYQECLNVEFNKMIEQSKKDKKVVGPEANAEREARIAANQESKVKLGEAYTATAAAYRTAHPPAPR
ncbi:MAG: hypothetical protein EXR00_10055 [Alphaproteobacteria bacterium]|nr:hypothetical protein [Alphaproteobacteria bacterium]